MTTPITPLENWTKRKLGLQDAAALTRKGLARYQRLKLLQTLDYARARSPFYRERLSGMQNKPLKHLDDFTSLPFTTADDLCDRSLEFLCVSQSDVSRVFTVQTWEPRPKRLYFTDSDLELTVDFFHHGMSGIVAPGQKVLILLPGEKPGSVGDLLVQALSRMDVEGIVHGPVQVPRRTVEEIVTEKIDCLIGMPTQVLSLARFNDRAGPAISCIKSVLLSSDYVPRAIVDALTKVWRCPVFEHYGMTEMGFGGGVQCSQRAGYHLREADLLFEIINPRTGQPIPEGETGEIIFTTLTRRALPLIRYRTGDLARFIPGPCSCGSVLKRLDRIQGRLKGAVVLGGGHPVAISDLDEVVFAVPGVLNYQAEVYNRQAEVHLRIKVHTEMGRSEDPLSAVSNALRKSGVLANPLAEGSLVLDPVALGIPSIGTAKRKIADSRREG
jgi:phenylacetate-coenzyme A ligase PaaK-like adenylate-forming protein